MIKSLSKSINSLTDWIPMAGSTSTKYYIKIFQKSSLINKKDLYIQMSIFFVFMALTHIGNGFFVPKGFNDILGYLTSDELYTRIDKAPKLLLMFVFDLTNLLIAFNHVLFLMRFTLYFFDLRNSKIKKFKSKFCLQSCSITLAHTLIEAIDQNKKHYNSKQLDELYFIYGEIPEFKELINKLYYSSELDEVQISWIQYCFSDSHIKQFKESALKRDAKKAPPWIQKDTIGMFVTILGGLLYTICRITL
jgi:hypothetical protein